LFFSLGSQRASFRNRRRSHVSNLSTDTDGHPDPSDDQRTDEFDAINSRPFPWIKTVIRIYNHLNNDFDKHLKSSNNLFQAIKHLYQTSSSSCFTQGESQEETRIHKHFQHILTYLDKEVRERTLRFVFRLN